LTHTFTLKIKNTNPHYHLAIVSELSRYFGVKMHFDDHIIFGNQFQEVRLSTHQLKANERNSVTVLCGIFNRYLSISYLEHKPPHTYRRFQKRFL